MSSRQAVYLAVHPHFGTVTLHRLGPDYVVARDGSLLVKDGKWWAVWSRPTKKTGGTLCYYLYQAKTLDGTQAAHNTTICGVEPALTFGRSGTAELVYRSGLMDVGGDIDLSRWRGAKWSAPQRLNSKGSDCYLPSIVVSGHSTWVSWEQRSASVQMVVQHRKNAGAWKRTILKPAIAPGDNTVYSVPQLVVSGPTAALAWTTTTPKNKEIVEVEQHTASGWSGRKVGDGTSGDAVFDELAVHGGRLYLVIDHSDATVYSVGRHT
jgi:hypothetical protein